MGTGLTSDMSPFFFLFQSYRCITYTYMPMYIQLYDQEKEKKIFFSLCNGLDTWLIYSNFIAASDVNTVLLASAGSNELSCSKLVHNLSYVYDCSVYGGGGRYLMTRTSLGTCGIGGTLHIIRTGNRNALIHYL